MRIVAFLEEEVTRPATPFAHTLIGRFSVKRPSSGYHRADLLGPWTLLGPS